MRRLRTPPDPRSIESVGVVGALVAHTAEGRLTLIDSDLRVRPIRGDARRAALRRRFTGPPACVRHRLRAAARSPSSTCAAGASSAASSSAGPCRHLGIDRDGSRLWVALGNSADEIAVLSLAEPARPRVVGRVRPPFRAHDVGFTPGGRRVWVTSGDRRRIAIYEADGELVRTIGADAPPQHVTFMGDRAFVTSGDDAVLRVHALDGRRLRSAPVPVGSYNVQAIVGRPAGAPLDPDAVAVRRNARRPSARAGAALDELRVARSSHDACFIVGT